jgi:hypothetical protein
MKNCPVSRQVVVCHLAQASACAVWIKDGMFEYEPKI